MGEIDRKIREIYNYIGFNLSPKMTQLLKMGKFYSWAWCNKKKKLKMYGHQIQIQMVCEVLVKILLKKVVTKRKRFEGIR